MNQIRCKSVQIASYCLGKPQRQPELTSHGKPHGRYGNESANRLEIRCFGHGRIHADAMPGLLFEIANEFIQRLIGTLP
jgi:hypothetical protein